MHAYSNRGKAYDDLGDVQSAMADLKVAARLGGQRCSGIFKKERDCVVGMAVIKLSDK